MQSGAEWCAEGLAVSSLPPKGLREPSGCCILDSYCPYPVYTPMGLAHGEHPHHSIVDHPGREDSTDVTRWMDAHRVCVARGQPGRHHCVETLMPACLLVRRVVGMRLALRHQRSTKVNTGTLRRSRRGGLQSAGSADAKRACRCGRPETAAGGCPGASASPPSVVHADGDEDVWLWCDGPHMAARCECKHTIEACIHHGMVSFGGVSLSEWVHSAYSEDGVDGIYTTASGYMQVWYGQAGMWCPLLSSSSLLSQVKLQPRAALQRAWLTWSRQRRAEAARVVCKLEAMQAIYAGHMRGMGRNGSNRAWLV